MRPGDLHALSFSDRLALAARLVTRPPDPLPTHQADQLRAATAETLDRFATVGVVLPLVDPTRAWHTAIMEPTAGRMALIYAALLGCPPCIHLRRDGPQPAQVNLACRRTDCQRCAATVRRPPPGEDDRCDWCTARGISKFVPVTLHTGALIVVGNCCDDCARVLGLVEAAL
jgi:hypothetical protein